MVHQRSKEALERRANRRKIRWTLKSKILADSWTDNKQAETVSRTSQHDLFTYGFSSFPEIEPSVIVGCAPETELGLVMSDSRGRGAFQK